MDHKCRLLRVRRGAFGFLCHRGSFSFGRCTERTDLFKQTPDVAPETNRASSGLRHHRWLRSLLHFWNKPNGLRFVTSRRTEGELVFGQTKLGTFSDFWLFLISGTGRYQEDWFVFPIRIVSKAWSESCFSRSGDFFHLVWTRKPQTTFWNQDWVKGPTD